MNYLEPWQLEGEEAVEIVVGTTRVAWTVDDDVFIYTGDKSEREDGYIYIGQLEWEDNNGPTDDFGHNEGRLRQYVTDKLRGNV